MPAWMSAAVPAFMKSLDAFLHINTVFLPLCNATACSQCSLAIPTHIIRSAS